MFNSWNQIVCTLYNQHQSQFQSNQHDWSENRREKNETRGVGDVTTSTLKPSENFDFPRELTIRLFRFVANVYLKWLWLNWRRKM